MCYLLFHILLNSVQFSSIHFSLSSTSHHYVLNEVIHNQPRNGCPPSQCHLFQFHLIVQFWKLTVTVPPRTWKSEEERSKRKHNFFYNRGLHAKDFWRCDKAQGSRQSIRKVCCFGTNWNISDATIYILHSIISAFQSYTPHTTTCFNLKKQVIFRVKWYR